MLVVRLPQIRRVVLRMRSLLDTLRNAALVYTMSMSTTLIYRHSCPKVEVLSTSSLTAGRAAKNRVKRHDSAYRGLNSIGQNSERLCSLETSEDQGTNSFSHLVIA